MGRCVKPFFGSSSIHHGVFDDHEGLDSHCAADLDATDSEFMHSCPSGFHAWLPRASAGELTNSAFDLSILLVNPQQQFRIGLRIFRHQRYIVSTIPKC